MFPASFSLSPKACVLSHLSDPAKSQKDNLHERIIQNIHTDLLLNRMKTELHVFLFLYVSKL